MKLKFVRELTTPHSDYLKLVHYCLRTILNISKRDHVTVEMLHRQTNIIPLVDRLQELRVNYMKEALANKNELITELVCDYNNYTAVRYLNYATLLDNLPINLRNYGSIRPDQMQIE